MGLRYNPCELRNGDIVRNIYNKDYYRVIAITKTLTLMVRYRGGYCYPEEYNSCNNRYFKYDNIDPCLLCSIAIL